MQTVPYNFEFAYTRFSAAYKMIGNVVPVNLANHNTTSIKTQIQQRELGI